MKSQLAIRLLRYAKLFLTLLYTVGLLFVLALLSGFKIDGWYFIAVLLVYLVTLPAFLALFSIIQLFITRLKYEAVPSGRMIKARVFSFWLAVCAAASVIAVLLFSFFSFNYSGFIIVFSYLFSIASAAITLIDHAMQKRNAKQKP